MVVFFKTTGSVYIALKTSDLLDNETQNKLLWLFDNASLVEQKSVAGTFIGPRKEMITPWSTNAVEITQNMGIINIERIEQYKKTGLQKPDHDPMLQTIYNNLDQDLFTTNIQPDPIIYIDDIGAYNQEEGLALSSQEVAYLQQLSKKIGRKLTDSEIFGFSQVNSEHCRHKIFNGQFIIDNKPMDKSLFELIKLTTKANPNQVVSAYKDNCAFLQGPCAAFFAPKNQYKPNYFSITDEPSVISLKAETHNFPTTVEPFNGAATGTGGEIRDRIGGGRSAFPVAGTTVYMTSYPRLDGGRKWEQQYPGRQWLYQAPADILVKASNGASDFGNKFGQPLICGSLLTFEHINENHALGYDKVIMLAGGIGYGKKRDTAKGTPGKGDKIILMGGDNYRIGMGGGAVSSVATGEYKNTIELNAVQRSNPEMQKRVYNAIRAFAEASRNPVISIHDHGAGGHLNCLSELVEDTGGIIYIKELPVGDPTLSAKEIIGNESQERMGLIIKNEDLDLIKKIAARERAPLYVIGDVTGDMQFTFIDKEGQKPIDLNLEDMFGNPPKTIMKDRDIPLSFPPLKYDDSNIPGYINDLLQIEAVACKDWLTNKVDRSVTGRIAKQQTCGEIQLPLNNVGVITIDYTGTKGIANTLGHAPVSGLGDPVNGSILSVAEALTNIVWAPLKNGIKGISLSANWMWPCKNPGEDTRLYKAVQGISDFAIALEINIPTGKDSLSMTQKYPDGKSVYAPGTVIISAAGEVTDVKKIVEPVIQYKTASTIIYIDMSNGDFNLGGSSFAQLLNNPGSNTPSVNDPASFSNAFNTVQWLIENELILAGHDISAGGMITTLLEMNFPNDHSGLEIDLSAFAENDLCRLLFSEKPGLIIQVEDLQKVNEKLESNKINYKVIGKPIQKRILNIKKDEKNILELDIDQYRDTWFKTSYLLDEKQSGEEKAKQRYEQYKTQPLYYKFGKSFTGEYKQFGIDPLRRQPSGIKTAIIREKGVNGDREMAYAMYLAGMDVKDIHMTDLITGRETLDDIHLIVFVGGFSNSDVLGSAKGWAGAFLYNPKAKETLERYYNRSDTLSLGICNGCQLMISLDLIATGHKEKPKMLFNDTHKFESSFINVNIMENDTVMFSSMAEYHLGIWIAHGEGKFSLPYKEDQYHIPLKYSYSEFPGNPNGSDYNTAAIASANGRHVAMMPHIERAIFPWQWAHYPSEQRSNEISPWIEAFVNAREWIKNY